MLHLNFTPFPKLETDRLLLRPLIDSDAETIREIRSNSEVNEFIDRPNTINIEDARDFIKKITDGIKKNECILWVIEWKNEKKVAGSVCLWNIVKEKNKAETGYELLPEFHGKGIMQEALSLVIQYGFEIIKLEKIEAFTHSGNHKSLSLLEKSGFVRDMEAERQVDMTKEPANAVIYSLYDKSHIPTL